MRKTPETIEMRQRAFHRGPGKRAPGAARLDQYQHLRDVTGARGKVSVVGGKLGEQLRLQFRRYVGRLCPARARAAPDRQRDQNQRRNDAPARPVRRWALAMNLVRGLNGHPQADHRRTPTTNGRSFPDLRR